ncbi:M48 family metalloprotease, partial [Ascidiaceihabitans sp.]|nr:M48 family metalloprotease [Ascidiaceihabitans sp.]
MNFHRFFARSSIVAAVMATLMALTTATAHARGLLRDADAEYALQQIAAPVLRAAGLSLTRVKVLIVNDSSLNAFVIGDDAIFINYGLINKMQRADMLQGVIAHEAAHIVNGHITRRLSNLANSRTIAGLGIALAIATAVAGSSDGAVGIALGSQSLAQRIFFKHTRAEEASADQSGVRFLRRAGISTKGMLDVFEIFRGQELLAETHQDPYTRSHPLSRDRIRSLEGFVATDTEPVKSDADYWFARLKGKITAYTRAPKWTLRRIGETEYKDVARLREAV